MQSLIQTNVFKWNDNKSIKFWVNVKHKEKERKSQESHVFEKNDWKEKLEQIEFFSWK